MRLITRADPDGLTCYILLSEVEEVDDIVFTHPKDMQDGKLEVHKGDIIANLPYHPLCSLWFDHHVSEQYKAVEKSEFRGKFALAPSAAQLIYEYYSDPRLKKYEKLVEETNKMDSAQLDVDDVLNPSGYMLLFYTIDPRTGLGPFKEYFVKLARWIKEKPVEEILEVPEVKLRCERVMKEQENFIQVLKKHSRLDGNVIVTDLRGVKDVPAGNRFLIYTLFPHGNISMRIFDGKDGKFIVVAMGHNIFNKTSKTNIGNLLSRYGGGGHAGAGTVQLKHDSADEIIKEILAQCKMDG